MGYVLFSVYVVLSRPRAQVPMGVNAESFRLHVPAGLSCEIKTKHQLGW